MEIASQQRALLRVLGVDPAATGPTGYAVVECCGQLTRPLIFGALKHPSRASFGDRLCELHRLLAELAAEFSPDAMALETVFAAPNFRTSLKLSEARGVVLLAAAQAGVAVHNYSPREVKFQVTGYGAASKAQMQTMVSTLLQLAEPPDSHHAADALALALCHIFTDRAQRRLREASERSRAARIEA